MDLKDKQKKKLTTAFRHALDGFVYAVKTERNLKIHLFFAIAVLLSAYLLSITRIEWLILILIISMTIALEMLNTAIENVVNMLTKKHHPLAKIAKDVAAGAVLISACASVVIGLIIFLPKLIELFFSKI